MLPFHKASEQDLTFSYTGVYNVAKKKINTKIFINLLVSLSKTERKIQFGSLLPE